MMVLDADAAQKRTEMGESVIVVCVETSPRDIYGMHVAKGILTARGGMSSHTVVVARGMSGCCVSCASSVSIDMKSRTPKIGIRETKEGVDAPMLVKSLSRLLGATFQCRVVGRFRERCTA